MDSTDDKGLIVRFNFRFLRALAWIGGGLAAALAAVWWFRRRPLPDIPEIPVAPEIAFVPLSIEPAPEIAVIASSKKSRRVPAGLAWGIGVVSCALLIIAAVIFASATPDSASLLFLIGGVGLGAALFLNPPSLPPWINIPRRSKAIHLWALVVGVVCMVALTAANLAEPQQETLSLHVQFLLLLAGIGSLVYGLSGGFSRIRVERKTLLLVGAITLIALVLRAAALDSAIRFFVDEATFAEGTRIAMQHDPPPLLARFNQIATFPVIYPYMESLTVRLFGRNLVGLRLISALFGTLTIPALYLLARVLWNTRIALAAAILLATFPPHLHFSRLSLNNIADPLFGILAFGWLLWGWRSGKRGYFALAGVALGFTQYFYDGGRLLYVALLILWLAGGFLIALRRGNNWHDRLNGLLVMAFVALIVAIPVYVTFLSRGESFSMRYDQETGGFSLLNIGTIIERAWGSFQFFVHYIDDSLFYAGQTPLLLVFVAPWFLIGLVYALWRALRGDFAGLLLALWIVLTALGNALLLLPRYAARYVVVFPALMLTVALGLTFAIQWLFRRKSPARYVMALAVGLIACAQAIYYFGIHIPYYNDQSRLYEDGQDAAFRSVDFPAFTQVHIVSEQAWYHVYAAQVMSFLRDDVLLDSIATKDFTAAYLESLSRESDQAFFLVPADSASQALLRRHFSVTGPFHSPYTLPPNREFWLFYATHSPDDP